MAILLTILILGFCSFTLYSIWAPKNKNLIGPIPVPGAKRTDFAVDKSGVYKGEDLDNVAYGGGGPIDFLGEGKGGGGGMGYTQKERRYNEDGTYYYVYRDHWTATSELKENQP